MGKKPHVEEFNSVGLSAAARFLGVSRQTLYTWIERGVIRAYALPGTRSPLTGRPQPRILRTDLERLKREREKK